MKNSELRILISKFIDNLKLFERLMSDTETLFETTPDRFLIDRPDSLHYLTQTYERIIMDCIEALERLVTK